MSINDRQLAFLRGQGYTGSINDAYRTYLLAQLGVTTGSIDDLLYNYLKVRWGYTGNLNDMMHAHLRYLGYTGSLSDMLRAAWGVAGIAGFSFSANLTTSLRPEYAGGSSAPTYTRATTATVTDHENIVRPVLSGEARFQGARRVANLTPGSSEVFSGWSKDFTGTVTAGVSDPIGGTTASTFTAVANNDNLYKATGSSPAGTYRTSWWIRRRTGTGTVNLAYRNFQLLNITSTLTTSWQRIATAADLAGVTTQVIGIVLGTAGDAVDIWHPQYENVTGQSNQAPGEYVSVGVLSTPFHGAGVDGVKYFSTTNGNSVASNVVTESAGSPISASTLLGYLAEGARTNLCLQSNAFTTTWVPTGGASPTQNQTGPDGATSAWTITGTGANYCDQAITLIAATYTASVFVKKTTGATRFPILELFGSPFMGICTLDTNNGVATVWTARDGGWSITTSSATCVDAGNFWRVSLTFLATAASWTMRMTPGGASSATQSSGTPAGSGTNVYYGAQVELASFASTYIPTTTASVVRNADVLTYPTAGNISASVGTCYAEIKTEYTTAGGFRDFVSAAAGFGVPILGITSGGASTTVLTTDGTATVSKSGLSDMSTGSRKRASAWGGSALGITGDGLAPATGGFDGGMSVGANIGIGCNGAGTGQESAIIRNVRIYSAQLSAAQLSTVTA